MSEYYKTYFKKNSDLKTEPPKGPETPVIETTPQTIPLQTLSETTPPKKSSSVVKKVLLPLMLLIIVLAGAGFGGWYYYQNFMSKKPDNKVLGAKDEKKQLLEDVGKLVILPSEDTLTIYTVVNVEKLRLTQPFFNVAEDGDKLLLYTNKAILYRPSEKKIVDIGPVTKDVVKEATSSNELNLTPTPSLFRLQNQP